MRTLLMIYRLRSDDPSKRNDHPPTPHTAFLSADEFLLGYSLFCIMHQHPCHGLTDRVRGEKLTGLFVMEFKAVIQHAEYISGLLFETGDEHAEEFWKFPNRFGFILLH